MFFSRLRFKKCLDSSTQLQKSLAEKVFIVHEEDAESSYRKLIDSESKAQEIVTLELK